jgi:hypothetical protein
MLIDHLHALAERETRSYTLPPGNQWGLPPATYWLLEMYCDESGCDCRRVFFSVESSITRQFEAVIAWGWEPPDYYAEWFGSDDPADLAELVGPILNLASQQSRIAPALMRMVTDLALSDSAYVARLKRHYAAFRRRIDPGGGSPRAARRAASGPSAPSAKAAIGGRPWRCRKRRR